MPITNLLCPIVHSYLNSGFQYYACDGLEISVGG